MRNFSMKLIGVLFLTFVFSACSNFEKKKPKIGLSMDTYTQERWQKDGEFFKKKVEELGGEVIMMYANGNEQLQNEQIETIINKGVDVLVIVPHNSKSCALPVKLAHEKGIKVISYDRMIKDCDLDLYVSFDNEKVGQLQARYLLNLVPKGNYLLVGGASTDQNSFMIRKGQMSVLQAAIDKGDIKIVSDQFAKDWLPYQALKHTEDALALTHNKIDAILAANDGLASGVIQSISENDLAGKIPVSGMDAELSALQRIMDGTQSMTVYKSISNIAATAAEAAVALAKKETPKGITGTVNNGKMDLPSILLKPVMVDKNNIEQTVIADGYIQKNQLKKR
jgi:D-xylose transport system substrate-binding protein